MICECSSWRVGIVGLKVLRIVNWGLVASGFSGFRYIEAWSLGSENRVYGSGIDNLQSELEFYDITFVGCSFSGFKVIGFLYCGIGLYGFRVCGIRFLDL